VGYLSAWAVSLSGPRPEDLPHPFCSRSHKICSEVLLLDKDLQVPVSDINTSKLVLWSKKIKLSFFT
jgi:hypothetical protein